MAEINGELLGANIAAALKEFNIPNTDENLNLVVEHIYSMATSGGFIYDEVKWLCENEQLEVA